MSFFKHLTNIFYSSLIIIILSIGLTITSGCIVPKDKLYSNQQHHNQPRQQDILHVSKPSKNPTLPTLIIHCTHYDPDCLLFLHDFEDLYRQFSGTANISLELHSNQYLDTDIPQNISKNNPDSALSGDCQLFPSWILLNRNHQPILQSCGGEHSLQELSTLLQTL